MILYYNVIKKSRCDWENVIVLKQSAKMKENNVEEYASEDATAVIVEASNVSGTPRGRKLSLFRSRNQSETTETLNDEKNDGATTTITSLEKVSIENINANANAFDASTRRRRASSVTGTRNYRGMSWRNEKTIEFLNELKWNDMIHIFDSLVVAVSQLMKDSLNRFKSTDAFARWLKQKNKELQ